MKTNSSAFFVITSLIFSSVAYAGYASDPAFSAQDASKLKPVLLQTEKFKSHRDERYVYGPISFVYREEEKELAGGPILKVVDAFGKPVYGPTPVYGGPPIGFGPLWVGDLNHDGKPDYIVQSGSGGNGLAGDQARVYFILSGETQPTVFAIDTYAFTPTDVVTLADGQTGVLVTRQLYCAETTDHKVHRFIITDLLRLDGKSEPGFPKWRKYNHSKNPRTPDTLTEVTREKIWHAELTKRPLRVDTFSPWKLDL